METITHYFNASAAWLLTPLGFIFVLTVVVFFHELGHFVVARWCGVTVKAFSIGFGPEISGFTDKKGTRWRLCWIPLGGYVKFVDDDNVASSSGKTLTRLTPKEREGSFRDKPVGKRAAIVAAGPIANFLLAIVIFTFIFSVFGQQITAAKVDSIGPGSAAERAGFKPGDLILSIDGEQIESFNDMQRIVSASPNQALHFIVKRGDQTVNLVATPEFKESTDNFGNKMRIGLLGIQRNAQPEEWTVKRQNPVEAFGDAVKECYFIVTRSLGALFGIISGRESADQLGGPIRIAQLSGQVAELGFIPLLNLAAVLSVSIGLLNLFPIPMLDGGHLLFYGIEAIRGKPLSEYTQEIGFRIGLALILMLMIFATGNDLIRIDWNNLIHMMFS